MPANGVLIDRSRFSRGMLISVRACIVEASCRACAPACLLMDVGLGRFFFTGSSCKSIKQFL